MVCCHLVAIYPGPLGNILALDYDFNTSCSRLLHQPADVAELQNGLKDSRDLCFSRGVAYIAEHGNASRFGDLDGKVRLNPNSLRSRADLERTLSYYNLSIDGTVLTLRKRAQNGKPGHTNLLLKPYDSYRIVAIYNDKQTHKQTNKHIQLNILVTQVTCT